MLEIRPNCEVCDKDLPPESNQAYICTYECTFCKSCVDDLFKNVCPNCGGGLCQRPIRPIKDRRAGVSLIHHPASSERVHTSLTEKEIIEFSNLVKDIKVEER